MKKEEERALEASASAFSERSKRRAKFAGTTKAERLFRRVMLDRDVGSKDPSGRSEKSRAAWRNDPRRDEKIYRYINEKIRSKQPVRISSRSSHIVSLARKNLADADRAGIRIIPDIFIPHWDHSSGLMKMIGWGLASRDLGATPFTLRLSPEVIEAARKDEVGTGRHIQDRLSRHLRSRLPDSKPLFWFAIEQGVWDEPHLHGAVVIPAGNRATVASALRAAGGRWTSAARQLQFGPTGNLMKWVGYSTKWLFRSMVAVGDENIIGATVGMRREAKRAYQDARSKRLVLYP